VDRIRLEALSQRVDDGEVLIMQGSTMICRMVSALVIGNLKGFEQSGGLPMSTNDSGTQWDLSYGWGNIEMLAIAGLRRYGDEADADRISHKFLSDGRMPRSPSCCTGFRRKW
jgi:Trehalase